MSYGSPASAQGKCQNDQTFNFLGEKQQIEPELQPPDKSGLLDSTSDYVISTYALYWLKVLAQHVQHGHFKPGAVQIDRGQDVTFAKCGYRNSRTRRKYAYMVGPSGVATLIAYSDPPPAPHAPIYTLIDSPTKDNLRNDIQRNCSGDGDGSQAVPCPTNIQLSCLAYVLQQAPGPKYHVAYAKNQKSAMQQNLPPIVLLDKESDACITTEAANHESSLAVPYAVTQLDKAQANPIDITVNSLASGTSQSLTKVPGAENLIDCITAAEDTAAQKIGNHVQSWAFRPRLPRNVSMGVSNPDLLKVKERGQEFSEALVTALQDVEGQCFYVDDETQFTPYRATTETSSVKDFIDALKTVDQDTPSFAKDDKCTEDDVNCFLTDKYDTDDTQQNAHGRARGGGLFAPDTILKDGPLAGRTPAAAEGFQSKMPLVPAIIGRASPTTASSNMPDDPGAVGIIGTDGLPYKIDDAESTVMGELGSPSSGQGAALLARAGGPIGAMGGLRLNSNGKYYTIPCAGESVPQAPQHLCEQFDFGNQGTVEDRLDSCLKQAALVSNQGGERVVGISTDDLGKCTLAYTKDRRPVSQGHRAELIRAINLAKEGNANASGKEGTYFNAPLPSAGSSSSMKGLIVPNAAESPDLYSNAFGRSATIRSALGTTPENPIAPAQQPSDTPSLSVLSSLVDVAKHQVSTAASRLELASNKHKQLVRQVDARRKETGDSLQEKTAEALRAQIKQSDLLVRLANLETNTTRTSAMAEDAHLKMLTRSYAYFGWGALALVLAVGLVRTKAG